MKPETQITLLWRPELQRILECNRLPKYKQKSKHFVQQKLLEKLDWDQCKRRKESAHWIFRDTYHMAPKE